MSSDSRESDAPPATLPLVDFSVLAGSPPAARLFVLEKFIPQREITLATGPGGAGKSIFGQQLCTCIAAGLDILGLRTVRSSTLYVTAEDDERELHWRQYHIAKRLSVPLHVPGLHISSIRGRLGNELCDVDANDRLRPSPTFQQLAETIKERGAKFVVLDNASHFFPGNENDRGQVTQFCNLLYRLGNETGSTIMLIAHPNKGGDSWSGSTAWPNAVRSHIVIDWPGGNKEEDPDARELRIGEKANYARIGERLQFRWHDFALVRASELPEDWNAALAATIASNREDDIFMECLAAATETKQAVSHHPGTNYYAAIFPRMREAKKQQKAAFERSLQRLLAAGRIELDAELWKGGNRLWKRGIKCTDQPHRPLRDPLAQTAPTERDLPSAPTCIDRARTDPLYINMGSAPLAAGGPDISDDDQVPF